MTNNESICKKLRRGIGEFTVKTFNGIRDLLLGRTDWQPTDPVVKEIEARCFTRTDISDHLKQLFVESIEMKPRLIVELGVRGGESTFVLERVARLFDIPLVSVDIEDCSGVSNYPKWHFIKSDDIEFAKQFQSWANSKNLPQTIDVLFIDTSHIYEHTVQEIKYWFPLLSSTAKVLFHDTNQRLVYLRKDGSIGIGWTNRGVMRAIEEYFGTRFPENHSFVDIINGWIIKHEPRCNGFTVLTRFFNVNNSKNENRNFRQ